MVERFAPLHGKAAPDAVDGTALHEGGLLLPVDRLEPGGIPHAAERFGGDLHIDPGGNAVVVQINIGRIGVASHNDLGEAAVLRFRLSAGGQAPGGRRGRQQPAPAQKGTA